MVEASKTPTGGGERLAVAIRGLEVELAVKDPCEVYVGSRLLAGNLWACDPARTKESSPRLVVLMPDAGARPGDVVRVCFRGIPPSYFEVGPNGGALPMQRDEAERVGRGRDIGALVEDATKKVMLLLTLEPGSPLLRGYVESILTSLARDAAARALEGGGR